MGYMQTLPPCYVRVLSIHRLWHSQECDKTNLPHFPSYLPPRPSSHTFPSLLLPFPFFQDSTDRVAKAEARRQELLRLLGFPTGVAGVQVPGPSSALAGSRDGSRDVGI